MKKNKIANQYHKNGFIILNRLIDPSLIEEILLEVYEFVKDQTRKTGLKVDDDIDQMIMNIMKPGTELRSFVYNTIRYNWSLQKIIYSQDFDQILQIIGFKQPMALEQSTIRVDIPNETKFITPPHQDIRSVRSKRCVTVWFPFRKCNEKTGTMAVYAKSHINGLRDYKLIGTQNAITDKDQNELKKYERVVIKAKPGDVIFMNSFLIHESVPSNNLPIKLNGQIIINDAMEIEYLDKFYRMNDVPETIDLL